MQQTYKNTPIWGVSVTVETTDNGEPTGSAQGEVIDDITLQASCLYCHSRGAD